jgi:CheY-like chemotaxis protein
VNSKSRRVLLVDDDEILRFLAQKQFKMMQLDLDTAASGPQGLTAYKERNYDLVFMDLSMPGMSGLETISRIREYELKTQRKRTPIVVTTAFDESQNSILAGADDFLLKPVLFETLQATTKKFLDIPLT